MRSDPAHFALIAPASLEAALDLLATGPGTYIPIAGGTEIMVALNTGRLPQRSLLSLHHLHELRFVDITDATITLGSGTTFTDLRRHPIVNADLPLLALAASWTGSIANQNRGTIGGNIANASPAADSSPALLAYDASVTLISANGRRSVPYRDFHLGYKQTALQPGELVHSLTLKRDWDGWNQYIRKVGTRKAQAISKVALAVVARIADGVVEEIRIGAASLADRPIRCFAAEQALLHRPLSDGTIASARAALLSEAKPIDDIRSTAKYRAAVVANLLEEFLRQL